MIFAGLDKWPRFSAEAIHARPQAEVNAVAYTGDRPYTTDRIVVIQVGIIKRRAMTDLTSLSDEGLLLSYEDIRAHVMADFQSGGIYRFMGQSAKERANILLAEIHRRGLTPPTIKARPNASIGYAIKTIGIVSVHRWLNGTDAPTDPGALLNRPGYTATALSR